MELTRLQLKNYKQFKDLKLEFTPGINVILGQNEAGKSTIAQALLDGLYLNPASRSSLISSKKTWQNESLSVIGLDFKSRAGNYHLLKDFAGKQAVLTNLTEHKETSGAADVARALEPVLPFVNADVYAGTGFITHDDISRLHTNSTELVTAIQNLAVNGAAKVKVKTILETLEKQKRDLLRGIDRRTASDGKIKALRTRIALTESEHHSLKVAITENSELQLEREKLNEQIAKLTPEVQTVKDMLASNESFAGAEAELVKVKKRFAQIQDQIDKLEKLQTGLETAEAESKEYRDFQHPEAAADLEKLQVSANRPPDVIQKLIPANLLIPLSIAGLVLVVAGVVFQLVYLLLAGLVVITLLLLLKDRVRSKTGAEQPGLTAAVAAELLAHYQCSGIQEFKQKIAKAQSLATKAQSLKESLQVLTAGQSSASLLEQRNDILSEKLELEKQLPAGATVGNRLSQLELSRYRRDLENDESRLKAAKERVIEIKALLKQSDVNMEDLVVLEEKLEIMQRQLARLEEDVEVIDLVSAGISHAIRDVASASAALIEAEINKYLPLLTLNRYTRVKLTGTLELLIFSPEKNDWVDPRNELSRGTLDQVYFLARIAFIKLLTPDETAPVILDDPFLTFDEPRREQAMKILQELAQDYQIILFSFNPWYRASGNVIALN